MLNLSDYKHLKPQPVELFNITDSYIDFIPKRWKTIKDYPNYSVCNDGTIRNNKHNRDLNGKYVWLFSNKEKKKFARHQIVASHFIDNPDKSKYIHHLDFDHDNDHYDNLQWIEQKSHQYVHTVNHPKHPRRCSATCLSTGKRYEYESILGMAKSLDVNSGGIWMVMNGVARHHKGYTFEKI